MSAIKDGRYMIMLDRERHLLFSLNVIDEFQDKAGGIENLGEYLYPNGVPNFKRLKWLLTLLINEGAGEGEEPITETQVGRMIHAGNLKEVIATIYSAFTIGRTGKEAMSIEGSSVIVDNEDADEKNLESSQGQ